jgi:hypothetical protein
MILEGDVERALVQRVEKELGGMCEKFTSPGRRSVPDRIITMPNGRIVFVEVKGPGKKPSRLQERDHERRRQMGCDVRVIDTLEDARAFEP